MDQKDRAKLFAPAVDNASPIGSDSVERLRSDYKKLPVEARLELLAWICRTDMKMFDLVRDVHAS